MKKISLSVALATYNEEENLETCLKSVKDLTQEIVVVDGSSVDKTVEIARRFGAQVTVANNPPIFHINKQKALEACSGEWILQLDADEVVTPALAEEIKKITKMSEKEIVEYQETLPQKELFLRHQKLLEKRDGKIGEEKGSYMAFFVPRLNYFLGKFLRFGGVYPDGVIRLFKNGKAHFPCQNVHEQIAIEGRVGWLENDLRHMADKTFTRYLLRNSRYIDLLSSELAHSQTPKNPLAFLDYFFLKPLMWFLITQARHKWILDGY